MAQSNEKVILPENIEATHYDLFISTNLANDFKFKGSVAVSLSLKDSNISKIMMHGKQIELNHVDFIDAENKKYTPKTQEYNETDEFFTFDFGVSLAKGDGTLNIKYTGLHNNEMAGFYRSNQPGRDGKSRIMVSTQFEALDARRCLPCIDEPAQKATFTCALEFDKGLTALGNMPIVKTENINDKRIKVYFDKTPKMSTYLLAFCVGEFDYVETTTSNSVKLRVYTPVKQQHLGEFALHVGSKCLDIYDDMFGKPFPLPKMDMIAIPEFAMGAMENWGLVTYREVDILIDPDLASSQQKQRVGTVVAHELAHQWFGNLVTMKWWDDLWLNEGFATWMQNFAVNKIYPDWELWNQFITDYQASALGLDSLISSHPIQVPIRRAQEVEEVFDLISYHKGSSVVRLVHAFLGEKFFSEGLKLYMDRHAYGNTETIDLWTAWEEVSKKPVNKVMSSWTEQKGYPVVKVLSCESAGEKCNLKLQQEWFLADGSVPEKKRWAIPLFVLTEAGFKELELFTDDEVEISVDIGKVGWVKLNAEQHVPIRVQYTDEMWKNLYKALKSKSLSVIDRASLLLDAIALVKAGRLDPALFVDLIKCYKGESNYTVWGCLTGALKSIHAVVKEDKELEKKVNALANSLIIPAFKALGWEKKKTDDHLSKMLRALLISQLSTFSKEDPQVIAEARRKYEIYVKDPKTTELPAEYRTVVFRIVLASSDTTEEYETLLKLIDTLESNVEKKDIYLALGFVKSMKVKKEILEWAISGALKKQDFFYAIYSVTASSPEGLQLAWDHFKENFSKIDEFLKTASPSLMGAVITYSTMGFSDKSKAEEIEEFFKTHKTKMEMKVKQIVEAIKNRDQLKRLLLASVEFSKKLDI